MESPSAQLSCGYTPDSSYALGTRPSSPLAQEVRNPSPSATPRGTVLTGDSLDASSITRKTPRHHMAPAKHPTPTLDGAQVTARLSNICSPTRNTASTSPSKSPGVSSPSKRAPLAKLENYAGQPRSSAPRRAADVARTIEIPASPRPDRQTSKSPRADLHCSQENSSIDDSCFSAFSEIPDTTVLANLESNMARQRELLGTPQMKSPDKTRKRSTLSRSPSPMSRRLRARQVSADDENTTFLIDFTQQMEGIWTNHNEKECKESGLLQHISKQRSPQKAGRPACTTPRRKTQSILNLLDFELPPAPTPRSVPTITVREMESLKASYSSQISSLKASLSGRVAEVESLKRAIGDAERRASEAMEQLREERCKMDQTEEEKASWEKRGIELENLLNSVREEIVKSEAERDELIRQVDTYQARTVKAEQDVADMLAANQNSSDDGRDVTSKVQRMVAMQIDAKIEAVSRELHSVYKEKHERKVATLKKSYEARSEKRCTDLQTRVDDLVRQNNEMLADREATFSGTILTPVSCEVERRAEYEELKATLARIEGELVTSKGQQEQLVRELQQERTEKGDLVAAVDEMLALQSDQGPTQASISVVEDFRKSISRPSGLRPPTTTSLPDSRIAKGSGAFRSISSHAMGKSKMLASIERMGHSGNSMV